MVEHLGHGKLRLKEEMICLKLTLLRVTSDALLPLARFVTEQMASIKHIEGGIISGTFAEK